MSLVIRAVRQKLFYRKIHVCFSCSAIHVDHDVRLQVLNPVSRQSPVSVLLFEPKLHKFVNLFLFAKIVSFWMFSIFYLGLVKLNRIYLIIRFMEVYLTYIPGYIIIVLSKIHVKRNKIKISLQTWIDWILFKSSSRNLTWSFEQCSLEDNNADGTLFRIVLYTILCVKFCHPLASCYVKLQMLQFYDQ